MARQPILLYGALALAMVAQISWGALSTLRPHSNPRILPGPASSPAKGALLANGWRVTPAGTAVPLPGDLPLAILPVAGSAQALVSTGGYHDHSLSVVDLRTACATQTVPVGKAWAGLCLDGKTGTVYLSGGGSKAGASEDVLRVSPEAAANADRPVLRLSLRKNGRSLAWQDGIAIPGLREQNGGSAPDEQTTSPGAPVLARWIGGLALSRDGRSLYVADVHGNCVYRLEIPSGVVMAHAAVGYRPYGLALSPDGNTLAVSNWGGRSVIMLDVAGPRALHARSTVAVGIHPNALAYASDGRLYVANAGSSTVSVIDGNSVTETIGTTIDSGLPVVGATPDALAVSPDGKRLFVANAGNNAVAVIDVSTRGHSRVIGFIPTGWYPSALAVTPDNRTLLVGIAKGLRSMPNVPGVTHRGMTQPDGSGRDTFDYIGDVMSGALEIVPLPEADRLAAYTRQVLANMPKPGPLLSTSDSSGLPPQGAIRHVLYIIRENRTYDQVFGDIKQGNGDPRLVLFGEKVTPNAHALARQGVLLDNLYCDGEVSQDGHQWCDAAYCTDFTERATASAYGGHGTLDGDERLTDSPAGYLWDNCRRHGISYYSYGEAARFQSNRSGPPVFTFDSGLKGHTSEEFAKLRALGARDTERMQPFLNDLAHAEKTGVWPGFTVMHLREDHTEGTAPGAFTPVAHVAANDLALGRIVEAVSHSRFWPTTAIFVIEDDAQDGPDHVDAHRTVGLVISPYTRRGIVDSSFYTTSSFVHTMEILLGLPPMTQFDAVAHPLSASFQPRPNDPARVVYVAMPAQVDLLAKNPVNGPGAQASAKLDFSDDDRCDPQTLNRILWSALHPGQPMPAPVRSAKAIAFASLAHP
jgi:YVTN family beta-propeller protein